MKPFIDLHCHWLPGVDDGARDETESLSMLGGLAELGFGRVVATPHQRPGMFDAPPALLKERYASFTVTMGCRTSEPEVSLASEHFLDDTMVAALLAGRGLPYPETRCLLVEFEPQSPARTVFAALRPLVQAGWHPLVAHPERYRALQQDPSLGEELLTLGAELLLDAMALVGRHGRAAERTARHLLELDVYVAACSDLHRPSDLESLGRSLEWLAESYGEEELERLFQDGPREMLGLSDGPLGPPIPSPR